jgi:ABC-type glycerol-3-phosphate transport system substrate-binding protein
MNVVKKITATLVLLSLFVFSGCLKSSPKAYKINLEVWGPFDDSEAYAKVVAAYKEINPYIGEIKFRKLDVVTYEKDLVDALASGQGPDIFFIRNSWLPSFQDKIEPSPAGIMTEQEFRRDLVDVAAADFLSDNKIYAAPLSVDSLALYYNKDLFNAEGITGPPATWEELQADVKKLTKVDQYGNIIQQGVAMGTAYNINRSTDVLSLLMMQQGVELTDERNTEAQLSKPVVVNGEIYPAGQEMLKFYTDFALASSPTYSWNSSTKIHYSIDAFFENTAAMMINYSWQYPVIKSKNSKLNFAVAPVPQFAGKPPANFANYWGLAVAKNKISPKSTEKPANGLVAPDNNVRIHEAWQFIKFLTAKNDGKVTLINGLEGTSKEFTINIDPALEYLKATNRPAARRDILELQKTDPVLGPFAYGNLIAKSWYESDPEAIEAILAEIIDSVNRGTITLKDAMDLADTRITRLMKK